MVAQRHRLFLAAFILLPIPQSHLAVIVYPFSSAESGKMRSRPSFGTCNLAKDATTWKSKRKT